MGVKVGCQTYIWAAYGNKFGLKYPLRCVLAEVAATGFKGVDMSGYTIDQLGDPEAFKALMKVYKLKLVSMSNGVGDSKRERIAQTKKNFEWLAAVGVKATMVGGGGVEKSEDPEDTFKRLVEQCDELEEFGRKVKVKPAFHNHLWTIVETREQIERFLESTKMGWCPDTGHMAGAGCNCLTLMKKYRGKIRMGHIKDAVVDRKGKWQRFIELGRGNAGVKVPAILRYLNETKFNGWFTVEQDQTSVSPCTDQLYNANYLKRIGYL